MALQKVNRAWNYKVLELAPYKGPDYVDRLGSILDDAGRNGWELTYMDDSMMILKQLFVRED